MKNIINLTVLYLQYMGDQIQLSGWEVLGNKADGQNEILGATGKVLNFD